MLNLFFPLLVLVPIIGFLMWIGINSSLRTIHDLVRQIRTRSPDDLSAIPTDPLSRDLLPLGRSINQLLGKLGHSLTLERRFSDLAAHQLRTPQASVKLLLQMLRDADDEAEARINPVSYIALQAKWLEDAKFISSNVIGLRSSLKIAGCEGGGQSTPKGR